MLVLKYYLYIQELKELNSCVNKNSKNEVDNFFYDFYYYKSSGMYDEQRVFKNI